MAINKTLLVAFVVFLCYAVGAISSKNNGPMIILDGNRSISTPEGIGSPPTITTASLASTPNGLAPQRCTCCPGDVDLYLRRLIGKKIP